MPDLALSSAAREAQAARVLSAADEILAKLESSPDAPDRERLLLGASFLARLAAALLLQPDFPALPEGFDRLRDRDRARRAAHQLALSRGRQYRSYSKSHREPTPRERKPGFPVTEIDRRLAAETAATLHELEVARLDLLGAYLHLRRDSSPSPNPEVQAASLSLVDRYWCSHQRLLEIDVERPPKSAGRRRHGIRSQLHGPLWEHEVTWEFWRRLDPDFLFWSDPLPADPSNLSQQLWPVATTLSNDNRAQELLDATALDIADVRTLVESLLRTDPAVSRTSRRPPSRSNSANPSQEFCKSRSNSAK